MKFTEYDLNIGNRCITQESTASPYNKKQIQCTCFVFVFVLKHVLRGSLLKLKVLFWKVQAESSGSEENRNFPTTTSSQQLFFLEGQFVPFSSVREMGAKNKISISMKSWPSGSRFVWLAVVVVLNWKVKLSLRGCTMEFPPVSQSMFAKGLVQVFFF